MTVPLNAATFGWRHAMSAAVAEWVQKGPDRGVLNSGRATSLSSSRAIGYASKIVSTARRLDREVASRCPRRDTGPVATFLQTVRQDSGCRTTARMTVRSETADDDNIVTNANGFIFL